VGADRLDHRLDALLAPFLAAPDRAAVCTDFDGTLSPIVDEPDRARPLDGAVEALVACAGRYAVTAVLSGRPVAYLRRRLDDRLHLSGLYGLERVAGGEVVAHPEAERWRAVAGGAADRAEAALGAGVVERKGLSLTLHHRTAPERTDEIRAWAVAEAAASGLEVRGAKASVELHPPIAADKGTALRELVAGLDAVCFLGDDIGDLPAYDALAALRAEGVHTVGVGVRTSETPAAVLERADVLVEGPEGALDVLRRLAGAARP
jgi:trehalose 6-phosphate phosphatase